MTFPAIECSAWMSGDANNGVTRPTIRMPFFITSSLTIVIRAARVGETATSRNMHATMYGFTCAAPVIVERKPGQIPKTFSVSLLCCWLETYSGTPCAIMYRMVAEANENLVRAVYPELR